MNLSNTFQILGVEARLKIVTLLLESSPLCVKAITEQLDITQSAVSQHLRVLKMSGWVRAQKKGYWMHYSLNTKKLQELVRSIQELAGEKKRRPCRGNPQCWK